jgi:hypothetical protein
MRLPPAPERGPLRRLAYAIGRRRAGDLPDVVAAIGHHRRLLLGYGALEEMTARSTRVDERMKSLAELTNAVAIENYRSRFNAALGLEAHEYSRGAVCALPERAAA